MEDVQISVETTAGLSRLIRVQVAAARIEREVDARLKAVARTANLKGFRPGKVPEGVIRQRFGAQARREVVQELVQSSYAEAIGRERLRPVGEPRIEMPQDPLTKGSDLVFTASFAVLPDFEVQGLGDIAVTRPEPDFDDADMDFVIQDLRRQRGTLHPVDRPAREGDRVTIDYACRIADQPIAGGAREQVSILLGAGTLGAGFEKQIIGLRAGDERGIRAALGADFSSPGIAAELAGREADFTVRVSGVAEEQLPDVDAAFIRSFDIPSGDRDEFLERIREYMRDEFESRARADVKRQLLAFLLAKNPISVPAVLVEKEAAILQADAARSAGLQNLQSAPAPGAYLETAEQRVRLGLVSGAIIRDHGLVVDRERVRARIEELASDQANPDEIRTLYYQTPALLAQVEGHVMDEQLAAWLTERATVTPIPTHFRALKGR